MEAYVSENDGQPISDANGAADMINAAGWLVDHYENLVTITTTNGFTNGRASPTRATIQPAMPTRFSALINFITEQEVRSHAPTKTPNFACTPGCINCNITNYKTKVNKVLYKQATRSLYAKS